MKITYQKDDSPNSGYMSHVISVMLGIEYLERDGFTPIKKILDEHLPGCYYIIVGQPEWLHVRIGFKEADHAMIYKLLLTQIFLE